MTPMHTERKGEILVALSTVLWAAFPVVSSLTFRGLPPLFTGALSTLAAALFFAILLTWKGLWHECRNRKAWADILRTSIIIGIAYYSLVFYGMRKTSPGNTAILLLLEVLFAFILLGLLLRHEPLIPRHAVGGILMVLGAGVILFPKASGWHIGDVIIAIATAVPPIGNMYAQLARRSVSAEWIMFCRSIIGGIFLLIFATIVEPVPAVSEVSHSIPFLLLNGCLLLGLSKILWIDGINLIPITKATSFVGLTPLFTLILAALVLGEPVQLYHILSLLPIMAGMFLLTRKQDIEPGMP